MPMNVVTLWRRLPEDDEDTIYAQILTLTAPDGTEEELSQIGFAIPRFRHRVHVQLPPLAVGEAGDHVLKVYLRSALATSDDTLCFDYPIRVAIISLKIVIELQPDELEYLQRPATGQGGFQSLLRRLQSQIAQNQLVLSEADAERLVRYATQYGGGGFQGRLARVVEQARTQIGV
jgi:hypothetical protein